MDADKSRIDALTKSHGPTFPGIRWTAPSSSQPPYAARARYSGPSIDKVMVILANLADPAKGQAGLFDFTHAEHDEKRKKLMETVDRMNRLEGRGRSASPPMASGIRTVR